MTGTWRYPSDAEWQLGHSTAFVILGDSRDSRVCLFQEALKNAGLPSAIVIGYNQLAEEPGRLEDSLAPGCVVRIDSPGRDFETYRALLKIGAEDAQREGTAFLDPREVSLLQPAKGLVLCPRQWYLGFARVLGWVHQAVTRCDRAMLLNHPDEIAIMFDKALCHEKLREAAISVPPSLGALRNFDELQERMQQQRRPRVFVKIRNGSSASGVVAYETSPRGQQAWTTCEIVREGGRVKLFNSRRICRYRDLGDVRDLINALCSHGAHGEAWIPKASIHGRVCDLRVVTIAQEPSHSVVRLSRTPLTNLHLRNERADVSVLRERMDEANWRALLETCRAVARQFPRCLHVGIDVAVGTDFRRHAVLEVNAFGDLLHGITHNGLDTYQAELNHLFPRDRSHAQNAAV